MNTFEEDFTPGQTVSLSTLQQERHLKYLGSLPDRTRHHRVGTKVSLAATAVAIVAVAISVIVPLAVHRSNEPAAGDSAPQSLHLLVSDWKNGDSAMLALTYGTLIYQSDGCVGLRQSPDRPPALIQWPAGTHLANDSSGVIAPSGKELRFNSVLSLGGGYGTGEFPEECDGVLWGGVFSVQQPM